jgi:hypothetical protein
MYAVFSMLGSDALNTRQNDKRPSRPTYQVEKTGLCRLGVKHLMPLTTLMREEGARTSILMCGIGVLGVPERSSDR